MKKYKIVDRKAPRFRRAKYRYNIVSRDLWNRFKDSAGIKISWKEFKQINEYINLEIRDTILAERDGIILPEQMGNPWLGLFKMKERPINEEIARNTGEHATHFSFDTFGMQGKICWDFNRCKYKVSNYPLWGFVAHRDFKRLASKCFKENPELYSRVNGIERTIEYYKTLKLENELNTSGSNISGEDTK